MRICFRKLSVRIPSSFAITKTVFNLFYALTRSDCRIYTTFHKHLASYKIRMDATGVYTKKKKRGKNEAKQMVRIEHNRERLTDNEFNFIESDRNSPQRESQRERERERETIEVRNFPMNFMNFPRNFKSALKRLPYPIQSFPNSRIGIITVTPLGTFDFHRINY